MREVLLSETHYNALPSSLLQTLKTLPFMESYEQVMVILNLLTFYPEFVSENCIEVLGVSHEETVKHGSMFFFNNLSAEHQKMPVLQSQWVTNILTEIPFEDKVNIKITYCGMRFNHPKKQQIRLLFQDYFYEVNEERNPIRSFVLISDVSHLLKNDVVWFRIQYGKNNEYIKSYDFSTDKNQIMMLYPIEKKKY